MTRTDGWKYGCYVFIYTTTTSVTRFHGTCECSKTMVSFHNWGQSVLADAGKLKDRQMMQLGRVVHQLRSPRRFRIFFAREKNQLLSSLITFFARKIWQNTTKQIDVSLILGSPSCWTFGSDVWRLWRHLVCLTVRGFSIKNIFASKLGAFRQSHVRFSFCQATGWSQTTWKFGSTFQSYHCEAGKTSSCWCPSRTFLRFFWGVWLGGCSTTGTSTICCSQNLPISPGWRRRWKRSFQNESESLAPRDEICLKLL